ncbi:hypothetical protein IB265_21730 [Ensifer sp. ENS10]|uniref:hypothetical protein n=1 Tax=Sinorhizobium/Ensifer group TaxID=227292 RepID=UPI00070F0F59|nr:MULTISPECIES: hypothetical protein [Sinorhizobium/Ensifer group]KRD49945.1 hypothetical protein ASE60_15885 [Ensifer sp. Root278]MBD9509393.1 hypothetical protein [Ensifer sp. ENS10]MBV7519835.1 hypothetical protein [Ensifer sp. ENS12]
MNSARWVPFSLLLAGSPIVSAHANPAPLDEARLVQCMLEHTTSDDEAVFKDMMVAAPNDDSGALKASLVQLSSLMMNLALTKCEVGMSMLATPQFQAAAELYGRQVGEKLMKKAFEKLN